MWLACITIVKTHFYSAKYRDNNKTGLGFYSISVFVFKSSKSIEEWAQDFLFQRCSFFKFCYTRSLWLFFRTLFFDVCTFIRFCVLPCSGRNRSANLCECYIKPFRKLILWSAVRRRYSSARHTITILYSYIIERYRKLTSIRSRPGGFEHDADVVRNDNWLIR